jgi:hypothetical protein
MYLAEFFLIKWTISKIIIILIHNNQISEYSALPFVLVFQHKYSNLLIWLFFAASYTKTCFFPKKRIKDQVSPTFLSIENFLNYQV